MIEMKNISKEFYGIEVLHEVDLNIKEGEIHGLVGENGAGKSTLMNILMGILPKSNGQIIINGKAVIFNSPKEAQKAGISMVHQEFQLIPEMSVAENIFLNNFPSNMGWVNWELLKKNTYELFEKYNIK